MIEKVQKKQKESEKNRNSNKRIQKKNQNKCLTLKSLALISLFANSLSAQEEFFLYDKIEESPKGMLGGSLEEVTNKWFSSVNILHSVALFNPTLNMNVGKISAYAISEPQTFIESVIWSSEEVKLPFMKFTDFSPFGNILLISTNTSKIFLYLLTKSKNDLSPILKINKICEYVLPNSEKTFVSSVTVNTITIIINRRPSTDKVFFTVHRKKEPDSKMSKIKIWDFLQFFALAQGSIPATSSIFKTEFDVDYHDPEKGVLKVYPYKIESHGNSKLGVTAYLKNLEKTLTFPGICVFQPKLKIPNSPGKIDVIFLILPKCLILDDEVLISQVFLKKGNFPDSFFSVVTSQKKLIFYDGSKFHEFKIHSDITNDGVLDATSILETIDSFLVLEKNHPQGVRLFKNFTQNFYKQNILRSDFFSEREIEKISASKLNYLAIISKKAPSREREGPKIRESFHEILQRKITENYCLDNDFKKNCYRCENSILHYPQLTCKSECEEKNKFFDFDEKMICLNCIENCEDFENQRTKCLNFIHEKFIPPLILNKKNECLDKKCDCYSKRGICNEKGENCEKCSDGKFLSKEKTCEPDCSKGAIKNTVDNICEFCMDGCEECSSSKTCDTCFKGWFISKEKICKKCLDECETCDKENSCSTCKDNNFEPIGGRCKSNKCETAQHFDQGQGKCIGCHNNCNDCFGPSEINCLGCAEGLYQTAVHSCKESYEDHQFLNEDKCHNCSEPCASCKETAKKCTKCFDDRLLQENLCLKSCTKSYAELNGKCLEECPKGYFKEETTYSPPPTQELNQDNSATANTKAKDYNQGRILENSNSFKCVKCHKTCQTCSGLSATNCLTCNYGSGFYQQECINCKENELVLDPDGNCSENCPGGYFKFSTDSISECSICNSDCSTCSGPSNSNCLSCPQETHLHNSKCVEDCPAGFFKLNGRCEPCIGNCKICEDSNTCNLCFNSFFYHESKCKETCPTRYIKDFKKRECVKCNTPCFSCKNSINFCISCHQGSHILQAKGTCHKNIIPGFYSNKGILKPCKSPCKTCQGREKFCLTCNEGYQLNKKNLKHPRCKKECRINEGWVFPNTCKRCATRCLECSDVNLKCIRCEEEYEQNPKDMRVCVPLPPKAVLVERKFFMKKKLEVMVYFNDKIVDKNWNDILYVTLDDGVDPKGDKSDEESGQENEEFEPSEKKFDYSISRTRDQKGLRIKLELLKSYDSAVLTVQNTSMRNILSQTIPSGSEDNPYLRRSFTEKNITIESISFFKSSKIEESIKAIQGPSTKSMTTISASATIAASTFGFALIKLFQIFDFLKFINISVPINFINFMEIFETNLFDFVPNLVETDEEDTCNLHAVIKANDMNCYLLNNSSGLLAQILFVLLLKAILNFSVSFSKNEKYSEISQKMEKKSECCLMKYLRKLNNFLNLSHFSNLMIIIQMDLFMSVWVNMRSFWVWPFKLFINSVLSSLIVIFYLIIMKELLTKSIKLEIFKKINGGYDNEVLDSEVRKWKFLKHDLKKNLKNGGGVVSQIYFLRDFLVCFFIVAFMERPLFQIIPAISLYIFTLIFTLAYTPFKKKIMNFVMIVNQFSFVLILGIFLALFFTQNSEEFCYNYFGNSLIALVGLTVVVNVAICVFEILSAVCSVCKKEKKNKIVVEEAKIEEAKGGLNESRVGLDSGALGVGVMIQIPRKRRKKKKEGKRKERAGDEEGLPVPGKVRDNLMKGRSKVSKRDERRNRNNLNIVRMNQMKLNSSKQDIEVDSCDEVDI